MELKLNEDEVRILTDTVKARIDALLASIARADSRTFRDSLIAEGRALEDIYKRLGCAHDEWSEAEGCDFS
jgi:hypothetical protein